MFVTYLQKLPFNVPLGIYNISLYSRYHIPQSSPTAIEICYFFCSHPISVLKNFQFFFPLGDYLRGAHRTGFCFMLEHERTCRTLHPSGTAWNLHQDLTIHWSTARKGHLGSHETCINAMLDPPP